MMLRRSFFQVVMSLSLLTATASVSDYVNPMIGTGNHGHVFVGAGVPFGAVNVGPNEMGRGWDWCSGYNYPDHYIKGFSMLHLSGTGVGDLGDVCLMPVTGTGISLHRGDTLRESSGFFSHFKHENQTTSPGYYSVLLDRYNIKAEMTATERVGMQRYTFPASAENPRIIFDLENGISDVGWDSDRAYSCGLKQIDDTTIVGFRISTGWCPKQYVYFAAVFSQPLKGIICSINDSVVKGASVVSPQAYGQALLTLPDNGQITVKVGISAVSEENALLNLHTELPGWDFENAVNSARNKWDAALNRIQATFFSDKIRTIFYTALYHTMIAPQLFCDVNGDYRGSDGNIYRKADFKNYTTFSLWDTYRAFHPMATILFPEMQHDWLQTMIHINREQGFLPIWHLMGGETYCMVGISSVPVLADMCLKGFASKDETEEILGAMTKTMTKPFRDIEKFNKYGFVPYNEAKEDVSKTLEYALNDWSVARTAEILGKKDVEQLYDQRAKAYQLLYDKNTGFIRPKSSSGEFMTAKDFKPNIQTKSYTEGNPWQYLWLVPHDVLGLQQLIGSKEHFSAKLDSLFTADSDLGKDYKNGISAPVPDIAGLIGQCAHGNEPSHHIAYLYNYVGKPWKSAERLRQIMLTLYGDDHNGLPGNEDVGQMSAWYILSAVGLYQVEPCGGKYQIGSPLVNEAKISVGGGKHFDIIVKNNSEKNKYIQRVKLNGKSVTETYINYKDIMAGGTLEILMGSKPSKWGTK